MKLSHKIAIGCVLIAIGLDIQASIDLSKSINTTQQAHVFNVTDYNTALSEYNNKQYAIAYNTLLNTHAPKSAIKALFPNVK
jgi:hypothetical protein